VAEAARRKGLESKFVFDEDVPTWVIGDPVRLRQILLNLVSNAVMFTEKGSIALQVSRQGQSSSGVLLRFTVTDTGVGIHVSSQARLFDSFTQADNSTTRKYWGTGLGLTISKRLAELMGGMIGVSSESGHGSSFWFTVHLLVSDKASLSISP